jgi:hypothetical protein
MHTDDLTHEEAHALCCSSISETVINEARAAGISWSVILGLLVKYGPQAEALIEALVRVLGGK